MRIQDLHELPKFRDGLGYLYLERGAIGQSLHAIEHINAEGRTHVPTASLALLMLGPGTTITHEAIKTLADSGCTVAWVGEQGVRFYAHGIGETRKGYRVLRQAELVSIPEQRLAVVRRMYEYRFGHPLDPAATLPMIRGMEGSRVRRAYAEAARQAGILWHGRSYDRGHWNATDPVNRALSTANACLNGLCHSAILSGGYSPALGFVHTGKQLSFVYDIADLYKVKYTVPLAFQMAAESTYKLEMRCRKACRDLFHSERLLGRIIDDIDLLLQIHDDGAESQTENSDPDSDSALPGVIWSPDEEGGVVRGGVNHDGPNS